MRVFDMGAGEGPEQVSDRILTVPNLLSLARLGILPIVFFDLALEPLNHDRALILGFVFGATDWLDGYVARRFDQVTRFGKLLDPISDRLFIATVGLGMVIGGVLPVWVIVAILARDAVAVVGGLALLATDRQPPAVTKVGKAATFDLLFSIGFFLLASVLGTPEDPETITRTVAWGFFVVGIALYYVALGQYVVTILRGDAAADDGASTTDR
ncbi:MAG: CDP-alcohol phosphatidyltransferase family protein [Nitriliruptorales bacterium]|nr:CDP-alcohol phosphatidyltransferase family protein [Nitriliruptorales bacterium]